MTEEQVQKERLCLEQYLQEPILHHTAIDSLYSIAAAPSQPPTVVGYGHCPPFADLDVNHLISDLPPPPPPPPLPRPQHQQQHLSSPSSFFA